MTLLWLAGLLAGGASPCESAQLTLRELWQLDCRTAYAVADPDVGKSMKVEVAADGPLVSGKEGVLVVSLRNRSRKRVALALNEGCMGRGVSREETIFELEAENARRESAPVKRLIGSVGVLGRLDRPCPEPYVRVVLLPGGQLKAVVPFIVAARLATPAQTLRPGPLAPGPYTIRVSVALAGSVHLHGEAKLRVN